MGLLLSSVTFAQLPAPPGARPAPVLGEAEVERVIVTGSNIPTAEETGSNPVDTYRPADIEKLGIRNATDLTTFLPQQSGATVNLNIANGGTAPFNSTCAGCWPKKRSCWLTENVLPLVH
jgi:hypothetical protein